MQPIRGMSFRREWQGAGTKEGETTVPTELFTAAGIQEEVRKAQLAPLHYSHFLDMRQFWEIALLRKHNLRAPFICFHTASGGLWHNIVSIIESSITSQVCGGIWTFSSAASSCFQARVHIRSEHRCIEQLLVLSRSGGQQEGGVQGETPAARARRERAERRQRLKEGRCNGWTS
jgi:hypothetical protein